MSATEWPSHAGHLQGHTCAPVEIVEHSANASHDRAADLQRRINRTTEYVRELLDGPLDSTTRLALGAVWKSLITPVQKADSRPTRGVT